jgi:hypothetical protein
MALNSKGMSLIEVAVSILMLGIITFPLIYLVRTGSVYSAEAGQEVAALNLACAIIEEIKSIPDNQFGFVRGAASKTITLENRASESNGCYDGFNIAICSGPGSGQVKTITGYDGDLRQVGVDSDWMVVPDGSSAYIIYDSCPSDYRCAVEAAEGRDGLKTIRVTVCCRAKDQGKTVTLTAEKLKR